MYQSYNRLEMEVDYIREAAFEMRIPLSELARRLGMTRQKLEYYRRTKPEVKMCVQIEEMTEGKVTRKQLRDDWAQIWPELGE